jgi:hypothetical protein
MAEYCVCQIVGNFPIINVGIISASLRINQSVSITEGDPAIPLYGPASGDLAITGYAPLPNGEILDCPGKVNVSFQWEQKTECDWEPGSPSMGMIITHFIPRGRAKSGIDGSVSSQFSFETIYSPHVLTSFNASASSGPATPYFLDVHRDVYDVIYTGGPISIGLDDQFYPKDIAYLFETVNGNRLFPEGTRFYLTTFGWEYTPPNIPTTSYSFLVSYDGG